MPGTSPAVASSRLPPPLLRVNAVFAEFSASGSFCMNTRFELEMGQSLIGMSIDSNVVGQTVVDDAR